MDGWIDKIIYVVYLMVIFNAIWLKYCPLRKNIIWNGWVDGSFLMNRFFLFRRFIE